MLTLAIVLVVVLLSAAAGSFGARHFTPVAYVGNRRALMGSGIGGSVLGVLVLMGLLTAWALGYFSSTPTAAASAPSAPAAAAETLPDAKVKANLFGIINDDEPDVKRAAIVNMMKADEATMKKVAQYLGDEDARLRRGASTALRVWRDRGAGTVIVSALDDPCPMVSSRAYRVLYSTEEARVRSEDVRDAVVKVHGRLETVERSVGKLGDEVESSKRNIDVLKEDTAKANATLDKAIKDEAEAREKADKKADEALKALKALNANMHRMSLAEAKKARDEALNLLKEARKLREEAESGAKASARADITIRPYAPAGLVAKDCVPPASTSPMAPPPSVKPVVPAPGCYWPR